jgi:hypothetical protein
MSATIIYGGAVSHAPGAIGEGDNLWLAPAELRDASGWERKPQGLCREDECVPIPPGREGEFVRNDGSVNLAALARHLSEPCVHDDTHSVWYFGESSQHRDAALRSLEAPDFTLPDLDGNPHSLSDYRGRKVLLLSWASW